MLAAVCQCACQWLLAGNSKHLALVWSYPRAPKVDHKRQTRKRGKYRQKRVCHLQSCFILIFQYLGRLKEAEGVYAQGAHLRPTW